MLIIAAIMEMKATTMGISIRILGGIDSQVNGYFLKWN